MMMPKRKPLTGTLALIDAGERAQRAEQKVSTMEKALTRAIKARTAAKAEYLALVRENLSDLLQEAPAAQEVSNQVSA
jgi:hypothetical protein